MDGLQTQKTETKEGVLLIALLFIIYSHKREMVKLYKQKYQIFAFLPDGYFKSCNVILTHLKYFKFISTIEI